MAKFDESQLQMLFDSQDLSGEIMTQNEKNELRLRSYLPSPFIAAALPLRDVKKNVFIRKYNNITLRLTGGIKVPYGKYGRLLLTILTTHAVLSKNAAPDKEVLIEYKSLKQLLDEMQLPTPRSNDIKEQLECFANASFVFEEKVEKQTQKSLFKDLLDEDFDKFSDEVKATRVSTGSIPFIEALQYVEISDSKGETKQLGMKIKLSSSFAKFSQEHSVPIDYTSYRKISSTVGKDLYAWLIYRNNSITEPLYITRESIVNQFMPVKENGNRNQERINFDYIKDQLKIIQKEYYPGLKFSFDDNNAGITFYRSKTPVIENDTHYVLVTANV